MGYYKDTGSLWSMASAEAILKKRMPEKVGILPVAELLFVAESMWVGEHDMKGIDAIVMVRPTKSPVIFQQQLGRALTSGGNRTPLVFDLCNNFGSLGGIAGMQERMERAYEKKSEQGEKPIYEPKDFHVIDEIKDPRELAEELREALNPSTTIDEKISFLEEIAAQNGGQL